MSNQRYQALNNLDDNDASLENVTESDSILPVSTAIEIETEADAEGNLDLELKVNQEPEKPIVSHPLEGDAPTYTPEIVITEVQTTTNDEEKPEVEVPQSAGFGTDGVFANLSAKPEVNRSRLPTGEGDGEAAPDGPLPGYQEAMLESSPPAFEDSVAHPTSLSSIMADDLVVEGLPVGGVMSFIWNAFVSSMFQMVGFLLTYLLHINHAGRLGSVAGLGITFLNFGFQIRTSILKQESKGSINTNQSSGSAFGDDNDMLYDENLPPASIWLAYLLMVLGWVIIVKSVTEYIRLRQERNAVLASPETGAV